ncbi:unnamed protein product, partial [Sphacelaria rigidula]
MLSTKRLYGCVIGIIFCLALFARSAAAGPTAEAVALREEERPTDLALSVAGGSVTRASGQGEEYGRSLRRKRRRRG